MVEPVVVASSDTPLQEIARVMLDRRFGSLPVVDDDGVLVGIVTEADFVGSERSVPLAYPTTKLPQVFRRWIEEDTFERISREACDLPVSEIMQSPVVTATADEPIEDLVERMIRHGVSRVPVVADGKPIGIVSRHDLLRLVAGRLGESRRSAHRAGWRRSRPSRGGRRPRP